MTQKPPDDKKIDLSWLKPVDKSLDKRFVMERHPKHPKAWIVRPREPKDPKG